MLEDLVRLVEQITGGHKIPERISLETDIKKISLFSEQSGKQFWFYSAEERSLLRGELFAEIEDTLKPIHAQIPKAKPIDTYLIIICPVTSIDERLLKSVISIEENEYLYKKFVLYFTCAEYREFKQWYDSKEMENGNPVVIDHLLSLEEVKLGGRPNPAVAFFLRLLIKVPFLPLPFPHVALREMEEVIKEDLSTNLKEKFEKISRLVVGDKEAIEEAAKKYFLQVIGD